MSDFEKDLLYFASPALLIHDRNNFSHVPTRLSIFLSCTLLYTIPAARFNRF